MKKNGEKVEKIKKIKDENVSTKENKFKRIMKNYFEFYKRELKRKHIMMYVISLVLFAIFTNSFISDLSAQNSMQNQLTTANSIVDKNVFGSIVKEKIPIVALTIFAGITPYMYIPAVALIGAPYMLALDIGAVIKNATGSVNILSLSISSVLQLLGISLAIATGIYYCYNATKRFRYSQNNGFGIDDLKDQYYQIKKDEKKLNEHRDKKQKKLEKREKLNVKIEYGNIFISGIISMVIVIISTLIILF